MQPAQSRRITALLAFLLLDSCAVTAPPQTPASPSEGLPVNRGNVAISVASEDAGQASEPEPAKASSPAPERAFYEGYHGKDRLELSLAAIATGGFSSRSPY